MFAYVGLVAMVVTWVGGFYLLWKWRGSRSMSISEHAASSSEATKFFLALLVIDGMALYVWLVQWFRAELELGLSFLVTITATFAALLIAASVPDTRSWSRLVHRSAAYSMAFLFLPGTYLIVSAPSLSKTASAVGLACAAYMALACSLFIFSPKAKKQYLVFQTLYILSFQIVILSAAYL